MKNFMIAAWGLMQVLLFVPSSSYGATAYEPFVGHYVGSSIDDETGMVSDRDIDLTIKSYDKGFNVTWTTTIHRPQEKTKKAEFSINFKSTNRNGLYKSAMGKDMFGHETPLDPLKGDPFVWAVIENKTMTVNSLLVFKDGGYEIQTYQRTLKEGGMSLVFSRVRNGQVLKQIRGSMRKVKY